MPIPHKTMLLAAAIAAANAAIAQDQPADALMLDEVVVTAQKKAESLQDAPISMLAFDSSTLEKLGVSDVADIQASVPNLSLAPHPSNKNSITAFIRGVGNADLQVTKDPAVGVYLDGVYLGRAAGLATDVADIESIEVLRGPQGTLWGRNTTGGALVINSAKPHEAFALKQTLSAGNHDYWRSVTQLNAPLTDTVFLRAAFSRSSHGGWVNNDGEGRDFGADDKWAARVAMRWLASDSVTLDYAYDQSRIEGTQLPYQMTGITNANGASFAPLVRKTRQATLAVNEMKDSVDEVSGHALTVAWNASDALTLKSITAYRELDETAYQDYSASAHFFAGGAFPSFVDSGSELLDTLLDQDQHQWSQELQALGSLFDSRVDYVAGIYYFAEKGDERQNTYLNLMRLGAVQIDSTVLFDLNNAAPFAQQLWRSAQEQYAIDAESTSLAIFGQFTWTPAVLEDRLHVTVGLRQTRDEREAEKYSNLYNNFAGATLSGDQTSSRFTPALTLDFDVAEDINIYGKIATAYRAGGFNVRGTESRFAEGFDPEKLITYEAGIKSELFDRRMRLNAATFVYDYTDLQVDQSDPANISATDTFNAGAADMAGFEFDLTAKLAQPLLLSVGYGYLDAEYTEFEQYGVDVSNQRHVPFAPRHSYSVSIDYDQSVSFGSLVGSLSYHYEDEYFFSAAGTAFKDDVGLIDATFGVQDIALAQSDSRLKVLGWVRNLENKSVVAHQIDWGDSGFLTTLYGEPRTLGIDLSVDF